MMRIRFMFPAIDGRTIIRVVWWPVVPRIGDFVWLMLDPGSGVRVRRWCVDSVNYIERVEELHGPFGVTGNPTDEVTIDVSLTSSS